MRVFYVDARYERFVVSTLAVTLAQVTRDIERREDEYPGVRALATVPDQMIDADAQGELTILVGVVESDDATTELLAAAAAGA